MKKIIIFFSTYLFVTNLSGQSQPVDVADLTIKVGALGSEEMFYGFAEGDQIVFSFEELKGKELKEVEVIEYPNHSKFMDYKSTKFENKKINVTQKAVFQFKFSNSALSARICKVKIQRIPKNESLVNFNTNWKWKTLYDTTYVPYTEDSLVGYDKIQVPYTKKELIKVDTNLTNKELKPRIHTKINMAGASDKDYVDFPLPLNSETEFVTKEVVSWAYYFGTDNTEPTIAKATGAAAKGVALLNPVAGLALGAVSLLSSNAGKNLKYYLINGIQNAQLFKSGNQFNYIEGSDASIASNRFVDRNLQGTYFLCFDNNHTSPVDVLVRFSAVVITKTYENKQYVREDQKPKYVKLNKKKTVVKTSKIMVNEG